VCGRYVSVSTPEQLADHFAVDEVRAEALGPRYNVAPSLEVYAVIERDGTRRLGTLRWGLVPFWAKQLRGAPAPINARVESVQDNAMFARAFERRRCLLPADGFYEWQEREDGARKQPWFIRDPEERPLAFAGIWGVWRDPAAGEGAAPLFSCAILTMPAQGAIADLHDRMPVVLPRQLWRDWLTATPETAPHLQAAVAELAPPRLTAYPVGDRVNNVRNEGPALLEPGEAT
jgi:putative SOS response-associated peptidase YedK